MMAIVLRTGISFLLSLFYSFSCATKENQKCSSCIKFPQEKELKGNTVELDTALFRYPFRIQIEGDKAIVMNLHEADHYYHVFQYPGFKYLNSFGRRGDSPEEMLSADNVRCLNDAIWTLDANHSELGRFVFSLFGDSLLRDEVISLDKSLLRVLDFVQYDDSTFIIPSGIMGFRDVQVTDRVIYAVFHGRTFIEIAQQKGYAVGGRQSIYVVSLQGEPLCKYGLDRYINGIHVNEETKIIIATRC